MTTPESLNGAPAPGWYPNPDPTAAGSVRYWDGASWTADIRAAAVVPPPVTAPTTATLAAAMQTDPRIDNPIIRADADVASNVSHITPMRIAIAVGTVVIFVFLWYLGSTLLFVAGVLVLALCIGLGLTSARRRYTALETARQEVQAARRGGALWAGVVRPALDAEISALDADVYQTAGHDSGTAWRQLVGYFTNGGDLGTLRLDAERIELDLHSSLIHMTRSELHGIELRGERQQPLCILHGATPWLFVIDDPNTTESNQLLDVAGHLGIPTADSRI